MLQTEGIFFIVLISVSEAQNPISVQVSETALGTTDAEAPLHYTPLCKQEQREDGAILVNTHTLLHTAGVGLQGANHAGFQPFPPLLLPQVRILFSLFCMIPHRSFSHGLN